MKKILSPYTKGALTLKNHLVMAPMTRSRAIHNIPNDLMAEYYGQRAGAGLIITEGTSPGPEGLGYPRIPGIFNKAQIEGWRKTTEAVHKGDSKIFIQLMHTGRVGHTDNLALDTRVIGASTVKAAGQIYVDGKGEFDYPEPIALSTSGVKAIIEEYVTAAKNAVEAGFDGVEIHSANGYLPEQFLNANVNTRTDEYGGSVAKRIKFVTEITEKMAAAIGKEKVGIRFSPYSTFNDLQPYPAEEVHETYTLLSQYMEKTGIAYIHINANPDIPQKTYDAIRSNYTGSIILCGGLTPATAEEALGKGFADLVAFGRAYLANPDLDKRIEKDAELNQPDYSTLYTPDAKGFTDYPTLV